MARPLRPETARYELRASPDQLQAWQAAAEADDRSLASWIRDRLDRAAKKSTGARKKISHEA